MAPLDASQLASQIGYTFTTELLLEEALTHSSGRSARIRTNGKSVHENERLEFLGDRVLGLVIAEWLVEMFPREREGDLATKLNGLVRKETCAEVASSIDLERFIVVGKTERTSGVHKKVTVLGDTMESVVAAIYLDGGLEAATQVIRRLWRQHMDAASQLKRDAKTVLQEWAQARGLPVPKYRMTGRSGPDHNPVFEIEVAVKGLEAVNGSGKTKRAAEQEAAASLLRIQDIEL
ncbi:MAG: ribonuclease III [Pseudomonadota bacterium]